MHRRIVLTIDVFLGVVLLAIAAVFVRNTKAANAALSPFGDSVSLAAQSQTQLAKKVVYGFLPYWSLESAQHIHTNKVTDISFFALHIKKDGTFDKDESGYSSWRNSKALKDLIKGGKKQNVRFSVTVISHDDEVSDSFLACEECWATLAANLESELDYAGMQNVNLDFEYTGEVERTAADRYTKFVGFLNEKLDKKYGSSFVVVSSFADAHLRNRLTIPQELAKVSDALFIMAYDFHRPESEYAGPVAPIGGAGKFHEYDITSMLADYLSNVAPSKLIMGVPYYGYNWVVEAAEANSKRIPGNDSDGYSDSQTYADVMETKLKYEPEILWDTAGQSPYFTYISNETGATREVYFDNPDSLKIKYNLVKEKNLLGVGIWALGYDGGYQELWEVLGKEFEL